MKKRTFVCCLIFAVCFSQLAAESVFGQDEFTFVATFPRPEVSRFLVIAKVADEAINGIPSRRGGEPVAVVAIGDEWVDLQSALTSHGRSISLHGGPLGTEAGDVVISEIMWGSDSALQDPTQDPTMSQWIELYSTTPVRPLRSAWTLRFTPNGHSTRDDVIDEFSNLTKGGLPWNVPFNDGSYGQGGSTRATAAGPVRRLVSMERKIDYARFEGRPGPGDIPDGRLPDSWEASTSPLMNGARTGSPGTQPLVSVPTTSISKSVIFNEIANRSNAIFDWIELYNPGSSDVTITDWVLSKVTGVDKEDELFKFESDDNIVVPAQGFLLVVNEDPFETALAAGENVDNPNSKANNLPTKIYVNSGLDIPEKDYLLILRTEEKLSSDEKIVDIAGNIGAMDLSKGGSFRTDLWPLKAWSAIKTDDLAQNDDYTWVRDKGKDLNHGDAWKADGDVTGLGIDRNPDSSGGPTSGTPGFDNGAVKDKVKDLTESDPVVISEIMFGTGTDNLPQWIELFNPSKTQAVKLHNWIWEVQNTITAEEQLNVEFNYTLILPDVRIQPYQTVLIVSSSRRVSTTRNRFPDDRIIDIWGTRPLRNILGMTKSDHAILSTKGFYMKLSDPDKKVVDQVGNIDSNRRTPDAPAWILPGGNLDDGGRASMIRRKGTFGDGTQKDAWISAAATAGAQKVGLKELYYGSTDDLGTPGYRAGGPLPVQLSSFYSKRNDAGAVIITWATESELDNAGFNILRSVSRTGEFTRINAQLIPGAGTTGEKNTYTWTDTSAKPNVLYFYQIEDVSLDGEHRTLRTTRLRGYVGAAGKAATIWGELKSRD